MAEGVLFVISGFPEHQITVQIAGVRLLSLGLLLKNWQYR